MITYDKNIFFYPLVLYTRILPVDKVDFVHHIERSLI